MCRSSGMAVQIKFCGLTRAVDVAAAESVGATYVGVILAGGLRNRTPEQAAALFQGVTSARRVGVVGAAAAASTGAARLDVMQLHGDPDAATVAAARAARVPEIWAVLRIDGAELPESAAELFQQADAVVLDTRSAGGLGGTGRTFDWQAVAARITGMPRTAKLVLAGGLNPENVVEAIRCLRPDIVDVSSGVEVAPGVKDPILMSRFAEAVRSV